MKEGFDTVWNFYGILSDAPREKAVLYATLFWISQLVVFGILSPIFFSTYRQLPFSKKADWLSRVNSTNHAILSASVALYVLFIEKDLYEGKGFSSEKLLKGSLILTLGYFICDAGIIFAFFKTIGSPVETLIHHLLAGSTAVYTMSDSRGSVFGMLWVAATYFTEMSTPIVNLRWFVALNYRHDKIYQVVGISMMISFFVTRIIFFPAFLTWMFSSDALIDNTLPESGYEKLFLGTFGGIASLAVMLLNLYWFSLMIKAAIKIFFPSKTKSVEAPSETSKSIEDQSATTKPNELKKAE